MKMRLIRAFFSTLLAIMMLASSALAVQYVTFDDIPGDWNNYECAINWMGADYVPTSEHVWVDTDYLEGGEVAPGVFEYITDPAYVYEDPYAFLGYLYLNVPSDVLYVSAFEGNWSTNEYMLMNCVGTEGLYVELFFPSFDEDGRPLNTDRIYLYEYEVDGKWYYGCVTFYFRYDGEEARSFLPAEEVNDSDEPTQETSDAQATEDEGGDIAVIGGADGPTSIIVTGEGNAFDEFFSNDLEGFLSEFDEVISAPTTPADDTDENITADDTQEEPEATEEALQEEHKEDIFDIFSRIFDN